MEPFEVLFREGTHSYNIFLLALVVLIPGIFLVTSTKLKESTVYTILGLLSVISIGLILFISLQVESHSDSPEDLESRVKQSLSEQGYNLSSYSYERTLGSGRELKISAQNRETKDVMNCSVVQEDTGMDLFSSHKKFTVDCSE